LTPGTELINVVDTAIGDARRLYRWLGNRLRQDEAVQALLPQLAGRLTELHRLMNATGLLDLCSQCGQGPHGGCCFAEMAGEADATLLTLNLLLGGQVARQETSAHAECCFLGPHGCTLLCKPLFCLSYSCPQMTERLSGEDLVALDRSCAEVLHRQICLEDRIRAIRQAAARELPA
jgi:hypothetical protein